MFSQLLSAKLSTTGFSTLWRPQGAAAKDLDRAVATDPSDKKVKLFVGRGRGDLGGWAPMTGVHPGSLTGNVPCKKWWQKGDDPKPFFVLFFKNSDFSRSVNFGGG